MTRLKKVLILTGFCAILTSLYMWGIPAAVNVLGNKSLIEQKIFEKTGIKFDIINPKLSMGVFPSVWIQSDEVYVLNKDKSKALDIENLKFKIKLLPLIKKKIALSDITVQSVNANFLRDKNSKFYLGDYAIKTKKDSKINLSQLDLNMKKYYITLKDELAKKELLLDGKYLSNADYKVNRDFRFATKGVFIANEKRTPYYIDVNLDLPLMDFSRDKLDIKADIKDFNLASISEYAPYLTNNKFRSFAGILNINAKTQKHKSTKNKDVSIRINSKNLAINGKDRASSIIYDKDLSLKVNFNTIKNGIVFKDTSLESDKIHIFYDGKLARSGKKIPAMDFTVKIKPSRIEDVVYLLPGEEHLISEINFYKLKDSVFYGDGEAELKFKGNGERPFVYGDVKLRNSYLINMIKGAKGGAQVDLNFKGHKMLVDVFVPATNNQWVRVKGFAKIDGSKYSELDIKSSDAVIMETAQPVLNPLHEILNFKLGPVPIMTLKGIANVDIRSAGKKVDPHLFGKVNFKNATASFNKIHYLTMTNADGEVLFNDRNISFKSNRALINGQNAYFKGTSSVFGDVNVIAETKNQNIKEVIKIVNTSPDLADVKRVLAPFTQPEGIMDLYLNVFGKADNIEHVKFNKDLFARGKVTLHDAKMVLKDTYLPMTKINGVVNFANKDSDYNLDGYVRSSKMYVKGKGSDHNIDLTAKSDKVLLADCFDLLYPNMFLPYKKDISKIYVTVNGAYNGEVSSANNIEYNKIIVDGNILPNINSSNNIKINGGTFSIRNGVLKTSALKGLFYGNPYTLSFTGTNIYKKMKLADASFNFNNFDISSLGEMKKGLDLPDNLKPIIDGITDIKGIVDINGSMKNGKIVTSTDLQNLSFKYSPKDVNVHILNGKAEIKNNNLYLNNVNSRVESMPVFLNGYVSNIYNNPKLKLNISAKPTQQFFDRILNSQSVYPVKLKGDVNFRTELSGALNYLYAKSRLDIKENSSLYYMGATLSGAPTGDLSTEGINTNPISILANTVITPNKIIINSADYNQFITSQNGKRIEQNQMKVKGVLNFLKNNVIGFENLKIKTFEPTNARLFNILFKKPTIKQGVFTSDLTVSGTSSAPHVLGNLNITSIDIPLLDATVRDVDLDFQKDYINLRSKAVILTNEVMALAKIVNSPSTPYIVEDASINMDTLDMNVVLNALNDFDTENLRSNKGSGDAAVVPPDIIIVKNAQMNADKIIIKKAAATDFKATMNITPDHVFNVKGYGFNIANGTVKGDISYDLLKSKANATMNIKNADAQIIAENFFDLTNQVYGTVTGDISASCTGISGMECVKTLSGEGNFEVKDGRMPKLGSLEYLLKAGNLITGGITGVSINGIIDLITPLKTGQFDKISGHAIAKDGILQDINVYSSGQDLNMYMTGNYNLNNLVADMEIYGSLSKNFSTLLGKIGNMSLNRLFNTIPGININEINPKSSSNIYKIPNFDKSNVLRVFKAEIFGDINGSNYVKSFRWIKH